MNVADAILEIAKHIKPTYVEVQSQQSTDFDVSGVGLVNYRFGNPHNHGAIEITIPTHLVTFADRYELGRALTELMQQ